MLFFFQAPDSTIYAYATIPLSHGYPHITHLHHSSYPPSASCASWTFPYSPHLPAREGAELGFSIDSPETMSVPTLLIVVLPSLHRRFVQCLCIITLPPLCSAALLRCCTLSHTVTILHSGLSPSIRIPLRRSYLHLMDTSPCYLLVLATDNPHSVRYGYMVHYMLMTSPSLLRFPLLYALLCVLAFLILLLARFPKLSCLLRSRFYRCCLFSLLRLLVIVEVL